MAAMPMAGIAGIKKVTCHLAAGDRLAIRAGELDPYGIRAFMGRLGISAELNGNCVQRLRSSRRPVRLRVAEEQMSPSQPAVAIPNPPGNWPS